MIKRGLLLIIALILFSTIASALTAQDYYNIIGVNNLSGLITKIILFLIILLLIYRGTSTTIFKNNPGASAILSILISILIIKFFPANLVDSLKFILISIGLLALIVFLAWLISRALAGRRAHPARTFTIGVIVFILLLILFIIFLRIGEYLGYKGIFDYPFFYQITNYIDYFFQAEIFFNISQFIKDFRIFDYNLGFFTWILFIFGNLFIIAYLINLFRREKYGLFFFLLILYILLLIILLGYPY
ncbi:hypothetical protein HY498_01685 [Candidatus Woesearchaeota archaeon]|nr:hypothetical protein [Candidatus Woesearchaeota archaeon]